MAERGDVTIKGSTDDIEEVADIIAEQTKRGLSLGKILRILSGRGER